MWIYVNAINSIPVGVLLFTIYSIMNIVGYVKWRRQEKYEKKNI